MKRCEKTEHTKIQLLKRRSTLEHENSENSEKSKEKSEAFGESVSKVPSVLAVTKSGWLEQG